jgi:hypothetical protein
MQSLKRKGLNYMSLELEDCTSGELESINTFHHKLALVE